MNHLENRIMNLQELTQWYDFSDKTIVITGGTGILGGEMACALVGCGANVAVLDRNPNLPEELKKPMDAGPGKYLVVYGDVLARESLEEAAAAIRAAFGNIDMLINAAGGNHPQATTSTDLSFFDLSAEALGSVFDLNVVGTILPSQVFGRIMAEKDEGIILNISSMSAFTPLTRIPGYSAAKAGVSNFTQWLAVHMAQEYSPHIRVNALAPGFFLTNQNRFLLTEEESGELTQRGQKIIDHTPMARFGDPEDLLGVVLWLLSPASAFVTGVVLPIDGGFSAFSGV
jgi:NAD(P)-dependent dehydrogenase (short-subunit alcohol dehydrogenase family)